MSLGLPQHKVVVMPYDPSWVKFFTEEESRLRKALGNQILDIQHIGSTSVPGLPSKPIIDIAVAVQGFEAAFDLVPIMLELGYNFRGEAGVSHRHFFILGRPRTHHVHMYEQTSSNWSERIGFRDYLRNNPAKAKEYADLKRRLAEDFPNAISAYSEGKRAFIESIEKLAAEEVR